MCVILASYKPQPHSFLPRHSVYFCLFEVSLSFQFTPISGKEERREEEGHMPFNIYKVS